jgi:hypothetical protein
METTNILHRNKIAALRIERQHLFTKAGEEEYTGLYKDLQPGQNVYWNGFGDPPSLSFRADFDDIEFNRRRQKNRELIKGRFAGGNIGWIMPEDLELFACLYRKPLDKLTQRQSVLLELIKREGPLTIQLMKETTGYLVKEITPVLHRFQEAFLIYEDQYDGEWDRGWHSFGEMFPETDLNKYTRAEALKIILQRFAFRQVWFDIKNAKSFYKLPEKDIKSAVQELHAESVLEEADGGYMLKKDVEILKDYDKSPPKFVYAMHRNDFLVKSNEHVLKEKFKHSNAEYDNLQYLFIDGEFRGAVAGHFKNGPYILEDITADLPADEAKSRKDEILNAVYAVNHGKNNPVKRYCGEELQ